jgi:putative transposase
MSFQRRFEADDPDKLWVGDVTYAPIWAGLIYPAVVHDAWSRRVMGWAICHDVAAELVLKALNVALLQHQRKGVIHHSNQGSHYTNLLFGKRCKEVGVKPSMGSVDDAYDDAMAESFFATLECELIDRRNWPTKAEARMALFTWIEAWCKPRRRHSALHYDSPLNFEA